jgi:hypothetical protein
MTPRMTPRTLEARARQKLVRLLCTAASAGLDVRIGYWGASEHAVNLALFLDELASASGPLHVGSWRLDLAGPYAGHIIATGVGIDLAEEDDVRWAENYSDNDKATRAAYLARIESEVARRKAYAAKMDADAAVNSAAGGNVG